MAGRMIPRRRPCGLRQDTRGAALVEFALILPPFMLMLMGLMDFGFQIYAQSLLQGAVQNAARDTALEKGAGLTSTIDARVARQIRHIVPASNLTFERKNYAKFGEIGRPEDFVDTNGNDQCDNDEAFEDVNGNGMWDADRGVAGVGGARDAVVYKVTARFDRVFPFHKFVGMSEKIKVTGQTVLRNQPYQEQGLWDPVVGKCA